MQPKTVAQKFFKLIPTPQFLNIPYAGLDISDDAVRCIEYSRAPHGFTVHRFGSKVLPRGVVMGGEIKDEKILTETIAALAHELKISTVKASLPEEKMYLFKTEVPSMNKKEILQNIEFKLEENVPLSPTESVFFFDHLPNFGVDGIDEKQSRAVSVSVAPRTLIASYLNIIRAAGLTVLSFELQAKSIADALILEGSVETNMIVHIMNYKTGIYIVCGGVVCFTSTVAWGNTSENLEELKRHIAQIFDYWGEHGQDGIGTEKKRGTKISRIILSGRGALAEGLTANCAPDSDVVVEIAQVWKNAFSADSYIPPISYEDSLDFAAASGLALPS